MIYRHGKSGWLLLFVALAGALLLVGCRGRNGAGEASELFVSNQRFNIDDERGQVRIFGRLDNGGAGRFERVEVHAILRSRGGDKSGENSVFLEHVQPQEKRPFALSVTSHGGVADVELQVRTPADD